MPRRGLGPGGGAAEWRLAGGDAECAIVSRGQANWLRDLKPCASSSGGRRLNRARENWFSMSNPRGSWIPSVTILIFRLPLQLLYRKVSPTMRGQTCYVLLALVALIHSDALLQPVTATAKRLPPTARARAAAPGPKDDAASGRTGLGLGRLPKALRVRGGKIASAAPASLSLLAALAISPGGATAAGTGMNCVGGGCGPACVCVCEDMLVTTIEVPPHLSQRLKGFSVECVSRACSWRAQPSVNSALPWARRTR